MNFMKRFSVVASLSLATLPVLAGEAVGKVTDLMVRSDGLIYFHLSTAPSARPACAAAHTYWMIKDENSNYGKQQLSQLMMAISSGSTISVIGTGTCTRWGDGEDVNMIIVRG